MNRKKMKGKQKEIKQKTVKMRIASNVRDRRGALRNIHSSLSIIFFRLDKASFASVLKNIYPSCS